MTTYSPTNSHETSFYRIPSAMMSYMSLYLKSANIPSKEVKPDEEIDGFFDCSDDGGHHR